MDKQRENIDKFANTLVQNIIEQPAANLSELMLSYDESSAGCLTQPKVQQRREKFFAMRKVFSEHRGDVVEDGEVTCHSASSAFSEESFLAYPSSCRSLGEDSDISEIIVPDTQDISEEIEVCQSFLYPEDLEEEAKLSEDKAEVLIPETGSTSRLSIRSEDSERPPSSASSTARAITEAAMMLVSQVIDKSVRTLQSTEAVTTLRSTESARKAKKPAGKSFIRKLKSAWKSFFGRKKGKRVRNFSEKHAGRLVKDSGAPSKSDLSSSTPELGEEAEDSIETEMRSLPSPASTSSPPNQVDEGARPESQLFAETATDFQEEVSSEVLRAAADTEGEISTLDLADSCSQAFEKMSSETSMAQTVQILPTEGLEESDQTEAAGQFTKSPLYPEIFEKEAKDFKESEDATGSDESRTATSPASSLSITSAIFQAAIVTVCQVIGQAVRTLESIDSEGKAESPDRRTTFKKMKTAWKKRFGKKRMRKVAPAPECCEEEAVEERSASPKSDVISTPLKGQKEQDEAPAEHQSSFGLQQLFAEPIEVRPAEADNDQVTKIQSPLGPSEEDGDNEVAADQKLVLDSSSISAILQRFFQSLTEEQWREVSEGVYNRDVKEQLIDMCTDVLRFIFDSVITIVLPSVHQLSATSGTFPLRSPLSSEHLTENFNYYIQSSLESSFSQALCDITGVDASVKVSPEFTEAIAEEVIGKVNSALSVATQASLDGESSSATVPAGCHVSKDIAAKKTLAGAIETMKSFLTGQGTVIKRRIQTSTGLDPDIKEESAVREAKKKQSPWRRCFSRRQRTMIQPLPLEALNGAVQSASADLTSMRTSPLVTSSTTSSSAALKGDAPLAGAMTADFQHEMSASSQSQSSDSLGVEETETTKRNGFCGFFYNIFSKDEKKKKEEKKRTPAKQLPLWMRLFCCSPCSCCLDNEP